MSSNAAPGSSKQTMDAINACIQGSFVRLVHTACLALRITMHTVRNAGRWLVGLLYGPMGVILYVRMDSSNQMRRDVLAVPAFRVHPARCQWHVQRRRMPLA